MLHDSNIEQQIQSYIDGDLSSDERQAVEKMIAGNKVWKDTYDGLLELHRLLSGEMETMEPSMRFTKNVMDEIAGLEIAKPVRLRQNPWIFRIAGGLLGSLLLGMIVYMFSLYDFTSAPAGKTLSIPDVAIPKISWTQYIGGSANIGLFMICTILGLVLIDKYLSGKRKAV